MKLPGFDKAVVPQKKIEDYLLSSTHPDGWGKAVFFESYGFSPRRWEDLRDALMGHIRDHEAAVIGTSPFGTVYTVNGPLRSPDGRDPVVRSAWFIDDEATVPRLVTAYPHRKERKR